MSDANTFYKKVMDANLRQQRGVPQEEMQPMKKLMHGQYEMIFNQICSAGEVAAVMCMLTNDEIRLNPLVENVIVNQDKTSNANYKKTGVAAHLTRDDEERDDDDDDDDVHQASEDFVTGEKRSHNRVILKNHMMLAHFDIVIEKAYDDGVDGHSSVVVDDHAVQYNNASHVEYDIHGGDDDDRGDEYERAHKKCRLNIDDCNVSQYIISLDHSVLSTVVGYMMSTGSTPESINALIHLFDEIDDCGEQGYLANQSTSHSCLDLLIQFNLVVAVMDFNNVRYLIKTKAGPFLMTPYRIDIKQSAIDIEDQVDSSAVNTDSNIVDTNSAVDNDANNDANSAVNNDKRNDEGNDETNHQDDHHEKNNDDDDGCEVIFMNQDKGRGTIYDEDGKLPSDHPDNVARKLVVNPFVMLNGDVNRKLLNGLRQSMIEKLFLNPGLTKMGVFKQFPVIHSSAVERVLDAMLIEGLVYTKMVEITSQAENRKRNPLFMDQDDEDDIIGFETCYYASISSIIRCEL
ncbi:hypothetical protein AKO1_001428 [Acrasis kona]|uniref:Uncharacterized protein n=1 Tax=Acrasis kona TaxID=1008807 RepID=A0AAW2ZDA4_9EUKA